MTITYKETDLKERLEYAQEQLDWHEQEAVSYSITVRELEELIAKKLQ